MEKYTTVIHKTPIILAKVQSFRSVVNHLSYKIEFLKSSQLGFIFFSRLGWEIETVNETNECTETLNTPCMQRAEPNSSGEFPLLLLSWCPNCSIFTCTLTGRGKGGKGQAFLTSILGRLKFIES